MTETWCACKACGGSDPTQDTVKVDMSRLHMQDKENVVPTQAGNTSQGGEKEKYLKVDAQIQEQRLRDAWKAEERQRQKEAEKHAQAAAKTAEEERLREEGAQLARREVEEELLGINGLYQENEGVPEESPATDVTVKDPCTNAHRQKARKWCKAHGYEDVQTPKTTMRGKTKHVLHTAVKHEDSNAIKMLLLCGAHKDATDSKGMTALQLAQKLKPGSRREAILTCLSE